MNESNHCLFDRHKECDGTVEVGGFSLGNCDCVCHEGVVAELVPLHPRHDPAIAIEIEQIPVAA